MIWFILGVLVILAGLIVSRVVPLERTPIKFIIGGSVTLGVILILLSSSYTQDVGEALVVKNADGTIAREDTTAGWDLKAPWQDTISFDIKGQQALYKLDGKTASPGEDVDGPSITVTVDKLPVEVDVAVRYSIQPDKVAEIYTAYKSNDGLFTKVISQDIKTVVRDAAAGFTSDTIQIDRAKYSKAIEDGLKARWEKQGVIVDSVALQTVKMPQSVVDRINDTQNANQQIIKEEAQTKIITEQAKQKKIEAQGVADANNVINGSLTANVLKDKYIEALKNAKSLVVVPDGSTPMVQVPQG